MDHIGYTLRKALYLNLSHVGVSQNRGTPVVLPRLVCLTVYVKRQAKRSPESRLSSISIGAFLLPLWEGGIKFGTLHRNNNGNGIAQIMIEKQRQESQLHMEQPR